MRGYAAYLKEQKLPKANDRYALGREKYRKLLEYGEMITLSPEQLLEIGLRELQRQQQVFAEAAREIDPDQHAHRGVSGHPKGPSHRADPDSRHGAGPGDDPAVRDRPPHHHPALAGPRQVAETPQFMRATSFASMDTPGPFETKATEAYYYVTPVEPIGRRSKRRNGSRRSTTTPPTSSPSTRPIRAITCSSSA